MRSRPIISPLRRLVASGENSRGHRTGKLPALNFSTVVETRLLILNADPVFQDRALGIFDMMDDVETRIVRTMAEAVFVLLAENFDVFVVEGEVAIAFEQATNARQHFPSLRIVCLTPKPHDNDLVMDAQQQKITLLS